MYAAGGGYGHLTRSLSLARSAVKTDSNRIVSILANDEAIKKLSVAGVSERIRLLPIDTSKSNDEIRLDVRSTILKSSTFDVLIVDTFPRGVLGELDDIFSEINCAKFLVHRDTVPKYINSAYVLRAVGFYDHILLPGEPAPLEDRTNATRTKPWLIQDDDELHSLEEARRCLNVRDDSLPTCLVVLSGKPQERQAFSELGLRLDQELQGTAFVRVSGDVPEVIESELSSIQIKFWPLMKVLPAVDFLIGAGGYNTVREAEATGTPLLAIPQKRMYDQQAKRLNRSQSFTNQLQLIESLKRQLKKFDPSQSSSRAKFQNGTYEALRKIEAFCPN